MSEYVPDHIQACHTCLARKSPVNRREPMGHVPVYKKFERIAMDILDITTVSDRGNRYILVVADYFSKYTEAYPLPNKTARAVADMLVEQWMARFGFPLVLHSDQGREFENKVIHDICRLMCSVKTRTTPYHPQSDGLVERFNRTVISMLAMFVTAEKTNWDDLLPFLMLAYNSSVHASTGHTPFRIVFGEECSLPGNLVHSYLRNHTSPADLGEYAVWVKSALLEVYDTVRVQQGAAVQRQKRSYDAKAVAREFPIGAWVYRYNPALKKHKCDNAWMGPLRVVREPSGPNVAIQAHPDKPVRYHHKDMLKIVPAPIPAPIWPEERPPDEISLVASSVPPMTMVDVQPSGPFTAPSVPGNPPVEIPANPGPVVSFAIPIEMTSLAPEAAPDVSAKSEMLPVPPHDGFQGFPHPLDRGISRTLDYQGYRFQSIDHLYLGFMISEIGFPEKLRALARHKSITRSVELVKQCCMRADQALLDRWQDTCLNTLTEIMCYCCTKQPDYLTALRADSLLLISERHRELFLELTPSTYVYTTLCKRLQSITQAGQAPTPAWCMNVRKSRRRAGDPIIHSTVSIA